MDHVFMSGFFEEVKRRKVYRVAVAYIVVAGGIIQIASAVFPAWELPNWSQRLVIVLLLSGFPIALILAWAFDVTPQGIKTTPTIAVPGAHRRRNVIMLVATGVIISAAAGFFLLPRAIARKLDKSIAVLPFENLSDDKANAFFADGMQDDILTNLSKIGDLKVISRTSVMGYRGKTANVREIGKQLGVSNILEGSVRRSGNKVRVNVQLIDRKSTRLNSSHLVISYAVFCLKKKKYNSQCILDLIDLLLNRCCILLLFFRRLMHLSDAVFVRYCSTRIRHGTYRSR